MTQWWKCDFQVATPGEPRFNKTGIGSILTEGERSAAADIYMQSAKAAGLEVLALADHNSLEWAPIMMAAGRKHGVVVFPGFELTTGSGADGVHLLILADPDSDPAELQMFLDSKCGFGIDHPKFKGAKGTDPAAAPNTLPQILDVLDERFLAIAPHVFGSNGLARDKTAMGDIRWKGLHHDRLGAVDVGAIDPSTASGFKGQFVRRELGNFPCLQHLAFVSTSDAYALEDLGSRFSWVRMTKPTLEGLRQAFLDFEARIVCDWDPRLRNRDDTPNRIEHGWVESIQLSGTSIAPGTVEVNLDPRLTVLVGGRGSGKSTVVAGLRNLYGDLTDLPEQARTEAEGLNAAVFISAAIKAKHHVALSGESQIAEWSTASGSRTLKEGGVSIPTDFRVRVVSQKELFERAANKAGDPFSTSRNLLSLVDDALNLEAVSIPERDVEEHRNAWVSAVVALDLEESAVAQLVSIEARIGELARQVEAFESDENKGRRAANDLRRTEVSVLDGALAFAEAALIRIDEIAAEFTSSDAPSVADVTPEAGSYGALRAELSEIYSTGATAISAESQAMRDRLHAFTVKMAESRWSQLVRAAAVDEAALLAELTELGLDPAAYEAVKGQFDALQEVRRDLVSRREAIPAQRQIVAGLWSEYEAIFASRAEAREVLLATVADRSSMLRFTVRRSADHTAWNTALRRLLGLRTDGFLDDSVALSEWLWANPEEQANRVALWRAACVTGEFGFLQALAGARKAWVDRLASVDQTVRVRLAAEMADDAVEMQFLSDESDPSDESSWKELTTGSPGQRSASMLSFVLHHGSEPLVLDQPEDDLDTEWITELVVRQLRLSRWNRQLIVVTHNANIPVNADAERIVVLENRAGGMQIRTSAGEDGAMFEHCGAIEDGNVRSDIQRIMEGGVEAFVRRERRYNNELSTYRTALRG